MNNIRTIKIFADGGSRNNPGDAACGFVVINGENGEIIVQQGKYLGIATNNVAEWNGLIEGLEYAKNHFDPNLTKVEIFLDSELVVKQVSGVYKVKQEHLKPLHKSAISMMKLFSNVSVNHVFRADNKLADMVVNKTLDNYLSKSK